MTMADIMIFPTRGTISPPDRRSERQRRRDALRDYAVAAAASEGLPAQTWARVTWGLKDYEAKDLLRGNASENMYERLLHQRGPHKGFKLGLAILEAVTATALADHFASEKERVADERAAYEAEESRIAALEAAARERRSFTRHPDRPASLPPGVAAREPGLGSARVGRRTSD